MCTSPTLPPSIWMNAPYGVMRVTSPSMIPPTSMSAMLAPPDDGPPGRYAGRRGRDYPTGRQGPSTGRILRVGVRCGRSAGGDARGLHAVGGRGIALVRGVRTVPLGDDELDFAGLGHAETLP